MSLHYSTWRQLGMSVGIGYALLGTLAVAAPTFVSGLFNLHPNPRAPTLGATVNEPAGATKAASKAHADSISTSMVLLGARDLSIGVALLSFYQKENFQAMGTLITSGMILCAADVIWIWKSRGSRWGLAFAMGATFWGVIGLGLLEYL